MQGPELNDMSKDLTALGLGRLFSVHVEHGAPLGADRRLVDVLLCVQNQESKYAHALPCRGCLIAPQR